MMLFYPLLFHIANSFLRFLTERDFYHAENIYQNIASSCSGISVMLSFGEGAYDGKNMVSNHK